jgi:N-acetylneuraminic acid mutarotase
MGFSNGYSKKFWKYDIRQNNWQQVSSFPGIFRTFTFSFSFNDAGYVGGGINYSLDEWPQSRLNDLWCYSPEADQWIQKENLPFEIEKMYALSGANTAESGFCFYRNELFEYNPDFNFWEKVTDLSTKRELIYPFLFEKEGGLYLMQAIEMGYAYSLKLWRYEK